MHMHIYMHLCEKAQLYCHVFLNAAGLGEEWAALQQEEQQAMMDDPKVGPTVVRSCMYAHAHHMHVVAHTTCG